MKAKLFYIIPLLFLLQSCKLMSLINNEEVVTKTGSVEVKSPGLFVNIDVDNVKNVPFMFDTGASLTVINQDSIIDDNKKRKTIKFGNVWTPDGSKTRQELTALYIKTPWFESKNKIVGIFIMPKGKCPTKISYYGLIGIDAFMKSNLILELNNENHTINSYINTDFDKEKLNGYSKINVVFDKKQILIPLTINGVTDNYLLDTGNTSSIVMPFSKQLDSISTNKIITEGKSFQSVKTTFGDVTTIVQNTPIQMGDQSFNAPVLMMPDGMNKNMGMEAIKQFNWFINFTTKEVFIKKNSILAKEIKVKKVYYTRISNDKIIVIAKIKGNNKYNIDDEITSVNDQKVTPENICEMQDLLNKTEDWSALKLETIPLKN